MQEKLPVVASDHLYVLLFLEETCYIQENVWCFGVAGWFLPCKRERVGYEENYYRTVYSECQLVALIDNQSLYFELVGVKWFDLTCS